MAECGGNSASDDHSVFIKPCICGNTDAANFELISFPSLDDHPLTFVRCECGTEREQLYSYVGPEDQDTAPDYFTAQTQHTSTTSEDETGRSRGRRRSRRHNYGPVQRSPRDDVDSFDLRDPDVPEARQDDWNESSQTEFSLETAAYEGRSDNEEADQHPADDTSCADAEDIMANMEQFVDRVMRLPCVQCGGRKFAFIEDEKDRSKSFLAKQCTNSHCGHLDGVDDTMSIFDIIAQLSSNQYRAAECPVCKNDDAGKFIFERNEDGELCLKCAECDYLVPVGNDAILHETEDSLHTNTDGGLIRAPFSSSYSAEDDTQSGQPHIVCDSHGETNDVIFQTDADGKIEYIQCNERTCRGRCKSRMVPYYGIRGEDPSRKDPSVPSPKTQIHDLLMLQMGDHFALHQPGGYWHHGIVVEGCESTIKVIEYATEDHVKITDLLFSRGKIREHWIDLDPTKEEVYRFDYNLEECDTPEVVIRRARTRLGEDNYNLLTNNCEHFARWCKTGTKSCSQVRLFGQYCGTVAKKVAGYFVGGGKRKSLSMAYMFSEVDSMRKDLTKAYDQKKKQFISETEYLKIAVKRGVRGSVACVGTAAGDFAGSRVAASISSRMGAKAGSVMIPIPVAGAIVGATLGYVIGTGIGILLGRAGAAMVNTRKK